MKIGNLTIDGNLFLAPLAGVSNSVFRGLARKYGASVCYTEMISADGIARGHEKTLRLIDNSPDEHPIGIQLFGSNPEIMAAAVKRVASFGPDLIDLNLGCPVKKVVKKNGGAALLKDLNRCGELMAAAVGSSSVPVTIKIRSGWDAKNDVYLELGRIAQDKGISAVTLHPRSRTQGYTMKSDWSKIALLKKAVSIAVIGNGDIRTPEDAQNMIRQTGCDGVMIGRAAMKNPYIFKRIRHYLNHGILLPDLTIREAINLAMEHSAMLTAKAGDRNGAIMMRKHLAWYSRGFPEGAELRSRLKMVNSLADVAVLFAQYMDKMAIGRAV
jgi:tRNA-dihydrouridine synthase B